MLSEFYDLKHKAPVVSERKRQRWYRERVFKKLPIEIERKFYTFKEASEQIVRPCIYGLYDFDELFYIGQTKQPNIRFGIDYLRDRHKHPNLIVIQKLNHAGDRARVSVLVHDPKDLFNSEMQEIRKYAHQLVNVQFNIYSSHKCRLCGGLKLPGKIRFCESCSKTLSRKGK